MGSRPYMSLSSFVREAISLFGLHVALVLAVFLSLVSSANNEGNQYIKGKEGGKKMSAYVGRCF